MTVPLLDALESGPLVADGAMGTMIYGRGVAFDQCFDALNLTDPGLVAEVHRAYIDAGAELIETNTFGANRFKLAAHGLEDKVAEINTAAVELARRVVQATFKPVYIGGSVGPLGVRLAPYGRVRPAQAYDAFREQIEALVEAGVDLIIIETMEDLYEITQAVTAARNLTEAVPILATMTFARDDHTLLGDSPAKVARTLTDLGADIIGVNCSSGPAQVLRVLQGMRREVPQARFSIMPNAGWPEQVGGRIMYPATPEYFAEYALAFTEAGAGIVGGCCGTTPGHIAAMRAALDAPPRERPAQVEIIAGPDLEESQKMPAQPTHLAEQLAQGIFVVGVEMSPPKGFSTHKVMAGARLLAEAGVDVINVADNPRARMRMSAWAVCHLLQRDVGVETALHFPTRGRNLLRVQGDLLAAHALGVRNVFVVMGDPTAIGDFPEAMDDYDLVPSGLLKLIKQGFNVGVDHAGQDIGQPTSFFAGCAVNLNPPDPDREIKVLRRKLAAGADFALTQPVYETGPVRRFLERYADQFGPLELPLLVGLLPLVTERHANFLHNEVPGVVIPQTTRERMRQAGDRGRAEGLQIALETLEALREFPEIRGAYLMPPFGRYEIAAEIIEAVKRSRKAPA
ncbi:MAG: bifunctional homocysteine S-methyltransferase/methylenetetrahydrofolate reductase [Anaerolineae bacterium]